MKRLLLIIVLAVSSITCWAQYAPQYRPSDEKPDYPNETHVAYLYKMTMITGVASVTAIGFGTYFFVKEACSVPSGEEFKPFKGKALLGLGLLAVGIGAGTACFVFYAKGTTEHRLLRMQEKSPYEKMLSMGMMENGVGVSFRF